MIIDLNRPELSRRMLLRRAAVLAGGGALMAMAATTGAQGATTVSKKAQSAVAYQATPKGSARCNVCDQFVQPAGCKTVAGTISPTGWCNLYSPKW